VVAWLSNVDFILSVREEKFGVIFQFLLTYGWWMLIIVGLVWALQAHKAPPDPYKVHWGMVTVIGILAFAFGVLIAVYSTGSLPMIVIGYGADGNNCVATFDTSRLTDYRDKYRIALVCGISDPTIDRFDDQRIAVSSPFTINPSGVSIVVPYGRMAEAIQVVIQAQQQNPPQKSSQPTTPVGAASSVSGTLSIWHTPILVPKDADLSEIKRLSDVPKHGGKILEAGYF